MKWGCLLLNLGTPSDTSVPAVRRYLDEFLMDRRVIDIGELARWLLVKVAILPTRPRLSAEAYDKIWTEEGSPLLVYTERLAEGVRGVLGDGVPVEIAMRYGAPSIEQAMDRLRAAAVDRVVVFPLYPQYASATTGSSMEKVWALAGERWNTPYLVNVPPFFDHPAFIAASGAVARPALEQFGPDHVLMSFHGLPERQVRKSDESTSGAHCLQSDGCCDTFTDANRNCYRAQCAATARALAAELDLDDDQWTLSFQSRLGRDPWLGPATDEVAPSLARSGVKRLAVLCPAFVADCIETLEEIGIRAREDFEAAGGEELRLVPSLNADPAWVDAAARIIRENVPPSWLS